MPTNRPLGLILILAAITGWSMAGLFSRLLPLDAATVQPTRSLSGPIRIPAFPHAPA